MKKNKLKSVIKECLVGILNEMAAQHVETASDNLKKWLEKSPAVAQNLAKLRAEPEGSGSMWGVFLYDQRGNKMRLVGALTPQIAKSLLPQIKDEVMTVIQSTQSQQMPQMPPTPGQMPPIQPPVPGQQPQGGSADTTMFLKKEGSGLGKDFDRAQKAYDAEMPPEDEEGSCDHKWKKIGTFRDNDWYRCSKCGKEVEL